MVGAITHLRASILLFRHGGVELTRLAALHSPT